MRPIPPRLRPFDAGDVEAAGELLAARHAAARRGQPLLAERFEGPAAAAAEVAAAWARQGASGTVATDSAGRVVGYLLGAPKGSPSWGPDVWVESAGIALADGVDREVARDLYAVAAEGWVSAGRTAHYVLLPAHDRALAGAFFRLAFGLQHVHAIRAPGPVPAPAPGLVVRIAVRADIPALAELERELPRHQRGAPVFSAAEPPPLAEVVTEWEQDFDDPAFTTYVVERHGSVVGSANACALERSSLHQGLALPDHAGLLGFAAVLASARGAGAGRALGDAVIAWAAREGYSSVVTDWRATNLLSSRTWPRLGFEPTYLRLHRLVGY